MDHQQLQQTSATTQPEMQPEVQPEVQPEMQQMLPDVPLNTFPLSELLDRTVQSTYADLLNLAETLPSTQDIERKRQLIEFCFAKRKLFTKLLVLLRLSPRVKDILVGQKAHAFVEGQDFAFARAADDLFAIHNQMRAAKVANFDIRTAVDVLTTGRYQRLPSSIKTHLIPSDQLSPEETASTVTKLQDMIRMRLMCDEVIPLPFRQNMQIDKGCVTFTVQGEFSVSLTIVPNLQPHPWRVVDVQVLSRSIPTGYGGGLAWLQPVQLQTLKNSLQRKLADSGAAAWPIVKVYDQLHKFCLMYQIHILASQAAHLAETRWQGHMSFNATDSELKLEFWNAAAGDRSHREFYRLHVAVAYKASPSLPTASEPDAPDGIQPSVLESLTRAVTEESETQGLAITLYGILGKQERVVEIPSHLQLAPHALDLEGLLLSLTDHLSRTMIERMRNVVLSAKKPDSKSGLLVDESKHVFTEEHVKMVQFQDPLLSPDRTGSEQPDASSLPLDQAWVKLGIDPRTGLAVVQLADDNALGNLAGGGSAATTVGGFAVPMPHGTSGVVSASALAASSAGVAGSGAGGPGAASATPEGEVDPIARDLKMVETRINANINNTKQAILYLRRATTIKQVETAASYLGFEVINLAQMGIESPLRDFQTDEVRLVHLRFPGQENHLLAVAAGSREELMAADGGKRSDRQGSAAISHGAASTDQTATEFRVWILSLKPTLPRTKKIEYSVSSVTPSDVLGDSGSSVDRHAGFGRLGDQEPSAKRAKLAHVPHSAETWPRMDLEILSMIQASSRSVFAFAALVGQLEACGLHVQYLSQLGLSDSQIVRLDPKLVPENGALAAQSILPNTATGTKRRSTSSVTIAASMAAAAAASGGADPNALDPRSGSSNPHGLGDIFVYLEERSVPGAPGVYTHAAASAGSPFVVAKMRVHTLLLPSTATLTKVGEHSEYDPVTHVITFRCPVNGFNTHFVSEFRAIGSMLRLMSQLTRYTDELTQIGATAVFPDLRSVVVEWRGSTILRVGWQTDSAFSGDVSKPGRYAVSFERADGKPDEHAVLADLSSNMLNQTRTIFPLILTLNRVSRLVSALECMRRRRHALGQTAVTLEVLSFTHYRLVFPYIAQNYGFEFVLCPPNAFLMFDAAMPDLAAELGLGSLSTRTAGSWPPSLGEAATPQPAGSARTLRQLVDFNDTPPMPVQGSDQIRAGREGLLSLLCTRVLQASATLLSTSASSSGTHAGAGAAEPDPGAIVPLPHGILCSLSFVDTVVATIEGQIDVFCAMNGVVAYLKTLPLMHCTFEESNVRALFASETCKVSIMGQATGKWIIAIVPKDPKVLQQVQSDGKALTDKFKDAINALPIESRDSLAWLKSFAQLALLPNLALRELVPLCQCKFAQQTNVKAIADVEWIISVPPGLPEFLGSVGSPAFGVDRDVERISILISFKSADYNGVVHVPIRYNFASGIIVIWRPSGSYNPLASVSSSSAAAIAADQGDGAAEPASAMTPYMDMTHLHPTRTPDYDAQRAVMSSLHIQQMPMPDRVFMQASIREVPTTMGGPGKLFAVLKHLATRPMDEVRLAL
ncbi:mediator complex subunit MED14-domain-containing protein [Entophlyctis helioformis]|nr:mediator complex subunit MED14-domain-containing protein [Entophlyctis helioformis]